MAGAKCRPTNCGSSLRIAVIGTGASAVQVIPEIAPIVERLTVFQRTPIWCLPKADVPLSELFGVTALPPLFDGVLLVLIGLAISSQPMLFGMAQQLAGAQNAGKALSAINLAFFLGTALMQSATGVVATIFGLPAVLLFMAATLIVGTIVFLIYT